VRNLIVIPLLAHVQVAVTTPIFLHIFGAISTGADDVTILVTIACCQAAWAGSVTVTFLVNQQILENGKHPVAVFVEKIALGFLGFL